MHNALYKSIEEVYVACSAFPRPVHIDSCECCHTREEKNVLLAVSLDRLTCEDLNDFVVSSFNTIGDAEDFLYFLPRILELAFTNYQEFECDIGLLGHKLFKSRFWERGEKLRVSVDAALLAHFEHRVLQDTDWNYELHGWVCCVGNATPKIEPFLKLLFNSKYFKDFYDGEYQHALKGKLHDAFWEKNHGNRDKIVKWLLSAESVARYRTFHS